MWPKLIKNKIDLSFSPSSKAADLRTRSLVDALYYSLVQLPQAQSLEDSVFAVKGNDIVINERYANLLKAIYSNEMTDGLRLNDYLLIKSSVRK